MLVVCGLTPLGAAVPPATEAIASAGTAAEGEIG